jgi:hypothetical protein
LEENADDWVFCGGGNSVPDRTEAGGPGRYIEKGSKFVDMASTFLERMGQERGGYHNMPVAGGNRY